MFKLAGGDYYHVPATQAQQICPGLQTTIAQAVEDGTVSMVSVSSVSAELTDHRDTGDDGRLRGPSSP